MRGNGYSDGRLGAGVVAVIDQLLGEVAAQLSDGVSVTGDGPAADRFADVVDRLVAVTIGEGPGVFGDGGLQSGGPRSRVVGLLRFA